MHVQSNVIDVCFKECEQFFFAWEFCFVSPFASGMKISCHGFSGWHRFAQETFPTFMIFS